MTLVHKHMPFNNKTAELIAALTPDPTNTFELQATQIRIHKQDIKFINLCISPKKKPNQHPVPSKPPQNPLKLIYLRGLQYPRQLHNLIILDNPDNSTRKPYNTATGFTSLTYP